MSISNAINAARSGLQISGLRADIVANNVANATTPGYVRRSVLVAEDLVQGATSGVRSNGIARAGDARLTAERMNVSSDLAQANVLASTWKTLSARFGDTTDGAGLFQRVSEFENALSDAALTPESSTNLAAVLRAAESIVGELRDLSSTAASLRGEADRSIADGVSVVNGALKQIEQLNGRIAGAKPGSEQEAALRDERQRVLDTVSEYVPVRAIERTGGAIDVVTREGVFLLAGTAREIEFTPANAFGPERTLGNGALSGLSVDGVEITPGAASYGAVSSGMFGALFTLRDQDIPAFNAQIDAIAEDLVARLSDDAIDPTKTPGAPGLFVDPGTPGDPGLAGRIALNPAVDPAQGGEVTRLRDGLEATTPGPVGNGAILGRLFDAMSAVRTVSAGGIQGSFTSSGMVAHVASLTGQARVQNESVLSAAQTQHTLLAEAEQTANGVDIDAQMQELLLIEQAYAANARVIEVANQMLGRLMEL